jgi:type I restriction enzyme S subunit
MFAEEAEKWSYGISSDQWSLRPEEFKRILACVPPLSEQSAIVNFINNVNKRIQQHILAKKRLIKLLEEQKQAIILQAVTRGINPNVHLKHSGVEWLGDVPERWEVCALRYRYSQCLGKMLDAKREFGLAPVPYLRNTDVQWDSINTDDLPTMDIAPIEYGRYTVRYGDLLVCEGGEIGRCAIWLYDIEPCGFQKALHRLRPISTDKDLPRYMYYVFKVATKLGAFNDGHESTIAHLTGDKIRAHKFAYPSKDEQASIVTYLDKKINEIDLAIVSCESEITLLTEYRTRLIADVVTGKLDVREAAANLPDDIGDIVEQDILDEANQLEVFENDEITDVDSIMEGVTT